MKNKVLIFLVTITFLARLFSGSVSAVTISAPTFPECNSPQGSIEVHYSNGTHGIVGSTATYTGSDTVYKLSDIATTQCFCASDGTGIQTNWWKVSSLTQEEIAQLVSAGWNYVPDGGLWGLANSAYLTQNNTFDCKKHDDPGSSNNNSNNGSNSSSSNSLRGVLGLAFTGDVWKLYFSFGLAAIFFLGGTYLVFKKR